MKKRRVYEEVRTLIEAKRGGKMYHMRAGYQWGAWIIRLGGKERVSRSNGSGYPELDMLYQPKPGIGHPSHWEDYTNTLLPRAEQKLIDLVTNQDNE